MAIDNAEFADRLDRFLDAQIPRSDRSPNGRLLSEHELAPAVHQLRSLDDAPLADPRFADRLLEELMDATTLHEPSNVLLASGMPVVHGRDASFPSVPSPDASRLGRILGQLMTAALVLLVLAGSVIMLGPWRPQSFAWLPVLPATSGTPVTLHEAATVRLIDVEDAKLPSGPVQVYAVVTELQPGVSASLDGQVGTMSYRVEQGTVRISHSGVEQVVHAGEEWSAPVDGVAAFENVGDDVARIVEADVNDATRTSSLSANYASKFSDPQGATESFVISAAADLAAGPEGPDRIILERITIPPDAALAPYAKKQHDWLGIAAGRLGVALEGDRLPFRWDPGEERTYGLVESLPPIQPGTEITLRNAGDHPLVLYRLRIEPGAGGS